MKRKLFLALLFAPVFAFAQNEWERPQDKTQNKSTQTTSKIEKQNPNIDARYLEGAVPEVEGKVVFDYEIDVPGKTAQEIYDATYTAIEELTKGQNQFPESAIALVNKKEHIIAARFKEWLVFQNSFLSLDRTVFNYTIIAKCYDGKLNLSLSRINYAYEMNRGTGNGLETTAEKWITDKYGLNKAKTKLSKMSGKFRRKTIDRKDEVFETIKQRLQQ